MANFNFDELKQKAINTAENIADMSADFYKKAESKTKAFAKKAKLTADITKDKNSLRRVYSELGRKYFEKYGENPDEDFAQSCIEARNLNDMIKANQAELDGLNDVSGDDDSDIDVEIIIDDEDEEAKVQEVIEKVDSENTEGKDAE